MLEAVRNRRERHVLLSLQVVGCVLLDSGNATTNQLVIVNDMVGLGGKHSLDVVLTITHDKSESISSLGRRGHLLDLETLQDWYGEELAGFVGIVEDHAEQKLANHGRRWNKKMRTYSRAPCDSASAADIFAVVFLRSGDVVGVVEAEILFR